ncbi:MAG: hypothetical protein N2Z80_02515 [Hydrogenothermaceae bacterium]|nr:hypothetical protein [Hydrogenothermaceae bacterium]
MDKKEFLTQLAQRLESSSVSADIDLDINFFDESKNVLQKPQIVVKYFPTENSVRQKVIDISDNLYEKSVEDAYNFIIFQIEQFEEEIDSVEFSGE